MSASSTTLQNKRYAAEGGAPQVCMTPNSCLQHLAVGHKCVQGWLTVKGTGYRRERKGSPIANLFRQWCDAQARPCVMLEQGFGNDAKDTVLVDLATLRSLDRTPVSTLCAEQQREGLLLLTQKLSVVATASGRLPAGPGLTTADHTLAAVQGCLQRDWQRDGLQWPHQGAPRPLHNPGPQ